ncbi:MAG: ATP-binding protein [Deltaproteobacteria bacterium]|nr:ATP-binding protein [Deltaproteobacteria bacterium]
MPFHPLPAEDFLNRENELDYLKGLPLLKESALGGNVFLEGARGIGKTELLKQLYRSLFWESGTVPFYYSFKTANLKGTYFAKDYFTGFVRQFFSCVMKEPSIVENAAEPLQRLMPVIASVGLHWLVDCIEDFREHLNSNDIYWQIVAAISLPATVAQKSGKPVMVMLDDFDTAERLYESSLGDAHGLISLFGESMKNSLCPHVMTGSAGALESIFTDPSLVGMTERMQLGPLPEDLAVRLFKAHLANLKIACAPAGQLKFLAILNGNPLYIRNLAKAAWKMQKKELHEKDLIECYCFEVSEGETAFYWSSIFGRYVQSPAKRRGLLKLLMLSVENEGVDDGDRLVSGLYGTEERAALDALRASGVNRGWDPVLRDFIRCLYMKEVEGRRADDVREKIESNYLSEREDSRFELVIPMSSNAELVVAKAVEQIGRNMNFNADFLNHLQLALIEVCINAIEHSGSYEKKVFLKFITKPDKLEIIVENSGRPFSHDSRREIPVEESLRRGMTRGRGFKLVHAIMDDVKIERIGNRTRVILTKNIDERIVEPGTRTL